MDSALYDVHTGTWTNWAHGRILGATLTTTPADGTLLIAFISLFITLVGTHFWRIGCFIFHYSYSTEAARDGLYHQRQAILRNSANGASGLWSLALVLLAWRRTAKQPFRRIIPLVIFTLVTLGAFGVASTFSSRISTLTGKTVLISSKNCGVLDGSAQRNVSDSSVYLVPYFSQKLASSSNYVQQCYNGQSGSNGCTLFVKESLPVTTVPNATCPFSGDICKSQDSNIRIDTGYLDSNLDFGINTPRDQHWLYRRVTHCAPLKTEGYRASVSKLDGGLDIPYMKYFFGGRTGLGNGNLTYEYPILQKSQVYAENFQSAFADYSLSILAVNYYNGSISRDQSHFTPIQALQRPDADLYMIFLSSNAVMFTKETDDPWYSAHDHAGRIYSVFDKTAITDVYFADEPASPLACLIQHQVCDPQSTSNTTCTPLVSALDLREAAAAIWSDEDGLSSFMFSAGAGNLDGTSVSTLIMQSGLDSDSRRSFGEQGPIPNNQWQRDVARWTNISLAYTQQSYLDAASGPSDPQVEQFYTGPLNDDHRRLCRNQMILTTAYTNFSIFGLATVFIVGGLIIFISYALEPVMRWRKRSRHAYATLEWTMNDTLQMQRMAHEELGMGRWTNCDRDVPITEGQDRLAVLDLEDLKHPRLKVPPDTFEDILAGKPERGGGESGEETTPEKSVRTTESEVGSGARDSEQERANVSTRFLHESRC